MLLTAASASPAATGGPSIEERLARLVDLKSKGLLGNEDFNAREAKLFEER